MTLYEIRVYSFSQKDASERRQAKRNCREWKARRRFSFSWKQNDLVFLVLRNQVDNTAIPYLNPTGLKLNSIPCFLDFVRSLERHCKHDDDDDENDENGGDSSAKRWKRVSAQLEMGLPAERGRGYTMARKLDVDSRPSALFIPNIRTKTTAQKERDRKVQRKKRKTKRARRRAVKPSSNIEQGQPAISSSPEDFTVQHLFGPPAAGWHPFNIHDQTGKDGSIFYGGQPKPIIFDNNSFWSPNGGLIEEAVYTADGGWEYAPIYSAYGGWIPGHFLGPTVGKQLERPQEYVIGRTFAHYPERDGRSDSRPFGSFMPEKKTPEEKEAAEKDDTPSNNRFPTFNPPPELPKVEATPVPEPPKKYGSAILNSRTLSPLVKMVL